MKVKADLIFRECKKYLNKDGEEKIRVRCIDDEDRAYNFFFKIDDEHKKYLDLKKDTRIEVPIIIYKSNKDNGQYNMYVK